jgi:hypothetical protein
MVGLNSQECTHTTKNHGRDWLPCSGRPKAHPAPLRELRPYLIPLLARLACFVSHLCPPPSRTPPSSWFLLPSWARTAWFTHGAGAHVSTPKTLMHACNQTRPHLVLDQQQRHTKHNKVHNLIMAGKSLDRHSILAFPCTVRNGS